MIVVSNTSPINYLVLIDAQQVLPDLYGRVLMPTLVGDELLSPGTPEKVRRWFQAAPAWIEVREAPGTTGSERIHVGEAAAIALAKWLGADLVLMDDNDARRCALDEGLRVTGTLGVLRDAASRGLIDLRTTFQKLKQTNFRAPADLFDDIVRDVESARRSSSTPAQDKERGARTPPERN